MSLPDICVPHMLHADSQFTLCVGRASMGFGHAVPTGAGGGGGGYSTNYTILVGLTGLQQRHFGFVALEWAKVGWPIATTLRRFQPWVPPPPKIYRTKDTHFADPETAGGVPPLVPHPEACNNNPQSAPVPVPPTPKNTIWATLRPSAPCVPCR